VSTCPNDGSVCTQSASAYYCYSKIPSPPPPPPLTLQGYMEVTVGGLNGPCRGTSPTDNDVSAFGRNKITNEVMNCNVCADLCSQNVNATGYPYNCVAFECSPSLANPSLIRPGGPHCELWSKPANFAGVSTCPNDGSVCTQSASAYYCYSKVSQISTSTEFKSEAHLWDYVGTTLKKYGIYEEDATLAFVVLIFLIVIVLWIMQCVSLSKIGKSAQSYAKWNDETSPELTERVSKGPTVRA